MEVFGELLLFGLALALKPDQGTKIGLAYIGTYIGRIPKRYLRPCQSRKRSMGTYGLLRILRFVAS